MFSTLSGKASEQTELSSKWCGELSVPVGHFLKAAQTCWPAPLKAEEDLSDLIWGSFTDFGGAQPFCIYSGSGPVLGIAKGRLSWFLTQSEKLLFT